MLAYLACQKVKVDRSANAVVGLDCMRPSWLNVPKRDRASDQRPALGRRVRRELGAVEEHDRLGEPPVERAVHGCVLPVAAAAVTRDGR